MDLWRPWGTATNCLLSGQNSLRLFEEGITAWKGVPRSAIVPFAAFSSSRMSKRVLVIPNDKAWILTNNARLVQLHHGKGLARTCISSSKYAETQAEQILNMQMNRL